MGGARAGIEDISDWLSRWSRTRSQSRIGTAAFSDQRPSGSITVFRPARPVALHHTASRVVSQLGRPAEIRTRGDNERTAHTDIGKGKG